MAPLRSVIVIVVVILVILVAARLRARAPARVPMTETAKRYFIDWMKAHPRAREYEQRRTKISDITACPERFFHIEMQEPEHSDVQQMVSSAGIMEQPAVNRWIEENTNEVYGHPLTPGDIL